MYDDIYDIYVSLTYIICMYVNMGVNDIYVFHIGQGFNHSDLRNGVTVERGRDIGIGMVCIG